jgi:plasmid stabilization system protein ParE
VRVEFAARALTEIDRAARWWRDHRPDTRKLFDDELLAAVELLKSAPGVGASYPEPRRREVRRVMLRKTGYHLYYRPDPDAGRLLVLSVWSAVRGRGPHLR